MALRPRPLWVSIYMAIVAVVTAGLVAACDSAGPASGTWTQAARPGAGASATPSPAGTRVTPWNDPATAGRAGLLAAGSDPSVLATDVLIADKKNNRLIVV